MGMNDIICHAIQQHRHFWQETVRHHQSVYAFPSKGYKGAIDGHS